MFLGRQQSGSPSKVGSC